MVASLQVANLAQPDLGSRMIIETLNFNGAPSQVVDLTDSVLNGKLELVQSLWVDNADNPASVDFIFQSGPVNFRVRCPGSSQGYFPISVGPGPVRITCNSSGGGICTFAVCDFMMAYLVWSAVTPPAYKPIAGSGQYGLVITAVTKLTVPASANYAVITVEGQNARYTSDGTTPTVGGTGMLLTAGQTLSFQGAATLSALQFISTVAGGTIDVSYYS